MSQLGRLLLVKIGIMVLWLQLIIVMIILPACARGEWYKNDQDMRCSNDENGQIDILTNWLFAVHLDLYVHGTK